MTRTCKRCETEKPLDDFWRVRSNKLGRDYTCAMCRNEQRREREDGAHNPVLTLGLKKKANGLYPMYWERD
jgi:hypothetical protein